jgi:ACT domain-containing protein
MNREDLVYAVTEVLLRHLPEGLGQERLEAIVADLARTLEHAAQAAPEEERRRFVVISVLGRNRSGIVHAFSEILKEHDVDIVNINQTIVHGNFAMMLIVDPATSSVPFGDLKAALAKRGEEIGVQVYCQYEDMMRAANRI